MSPFSFILDLVFYFLKSHPGWYSSFSVFLARTVKGLYWSFLHHCLQCKVLETGNNLTSNFPYIGSTSKLTNFSFFFFTFIYLTALGLHCSVWTLSCGMWDLVSQTGIRPTFLALGPQNFSHWTTREVPDGLLFFMFQIPVFCLDTIVVICEMLICKDINFPHKKQNSLLFLKGWKTSSTFLFFPIFWQYYLFDIINFFNGEFFFF